MKMESMIEKVASAIWHEGYGRDRPPGKDQWPDGVLGGSHDLFRGMAAAAIEAMREPTEAMTAAGSKCEFAWGDSDGDYNLTLPEHSVGEIWSSMVSAALKENEEKTA